MPLQLTVDSGRCVACGLCRRLVPHLFAVVNHRVAVPTTALVDGLLAEEAAEAAMACPTEAVLLHPTQHWRS